MKIKLANGMELFPIIVTGEKRYVQRDRRDTLTFVFPVSEGITALDEVFTAENCESITIFEGEDVSYIHKGYTIRAELALMPVEIEPPAEETEAVYEDRIFVSMSERTDLENQVSDVSTALNAMLGVE
jgi:hypothetical protein